MFNVLKLSSAFLIAVFLISFTSQAQTINTIAGNGTNGFSGDGGQALSAAFFGLRGVVVTNSGIKYLCDGNRIRKIDASGVITTIAGTGIAGFSGDGGQAIAAQINNAYDIVLDLSGNICFSDMFNDRIRKIDLSTGIITTIAGGGIALNDGGPATNAMFGEPCGIAIDATGNLFVADRTANRVRRVNTSGIISTVAGTGLVGSSGENIPAVNASFHYPLDVAVDGSNNLFIVDSENARIRKVNSGGIITTFAGNGNFGAPQHNVPATSTSVGCPRNIAVDNSGNVYISSGVVFSEISHAVYVVNTGTIKHYAGNNNNSGFAGDGAFCLLARLNSVYGLATDMTGDVYISDMNNFRLRKISHDCIYPDAPLSISGTIPLCVYGTGSFTATPVAGATSYAWTLMNGATGTSNTNNITITLGGLSGGYISVAAINSCGLGAPTSFYVTATDINSNISPVSSTICAGQAGSLTASNIGGYSHQWLYNGTNIPNATSHIYAATQAGNYSVIITHGACVETSPIVSVAVNPTPVVTASGPSLICVNDTMLIVGSSGTGLTYQWLHNGQIINGANSINYNMTTGGAYKLIGTNIYNCSDTSNAVNVSLSSPLADINVLGVNNLCLNDLELYGYAGPNHTYQWKLNGANIPGATTATYMAGTPGSYMLVVTNTNGCDNTDTYNAVYTTGQAELILPVNDMFCEGASTVIPATASNNYTYQWYIDGVAVPGATTSSYTANSQGYHYLVVNQGVCVDTSDSVYITVIPLPAPVISVSGGLLSAPSGYQSYQWYYNGVAIPGANTDSYYATQDGDYSVVVSDNNGCSGSSNTLTLTPTAVNNIANNSLISLYPNPFSETATLAIRNPLHEEHTFTIYAVDGIKVRSIVFSTETLTIERKELSTGLYYYSVGNENGRIANGKLLVQ